MVVKLATSAATAAAALARNAACRRSSHLALLLRYARLGHTRPLSTSGLASGQHSAQAAEDAGHGGRAVPHQLDPAYAPMMRSMDLSMRKTPNSTSEQSGRMHGALDWEGLGSEAQRVKGHSQGATADMADLDSVADQREERRSPAAILGSKRIGVVVLPEPLVEAVTAHIQDTDPRQVRQTFLSMVAKASPGTDAATAAAAAASQNGKRSPITPVTALARAAAYMPAEYAAVRNVLAEIGRREGSDWLNKIGLGRGDEGDTLESADAVEKGSVVEVTSTIGAGAWALLDHQGDFEGWLSAQDLRTVDETDAKMASEVVDEAEVGTGMEGLHESAAKTQQAQQELAEEVALGLEPVDAEAVQEGDGPAGMRIQVVNASRAGAELATSLATCLPRSTADLSFPRSIQRAQLGQTSIAMSTFYMSTLPSTSAQNNHLTSLLDMSAEYIVLVDRSTPQGWQAISHARTYLLNKLSASSAYHVLAPCPHEGTCPIVAMGGRDKCSFSQRLQRPPFLRKTKHSTRGEEDVGYCYLVLKRDARPTQIASSSGSGRVGGVGREEEAKAARKRAGGRNVLQQVRVEGGGDIEQYEVFSLNEANDAGPQPRAQNADEHASMMRDLRTEAYTWPRLVAPPIKRSGHVVMDACCPNGQIQRMTFSKSHSKQGYYDARKSAWGDLFPHKSNNKAVVRTRGIKRLNKEESTEGSMGAGGSFGLATQVEEFQWPVGELVVDADAAGEGVGSGDLGADIDPAAMNHIRFSGDVGPEATGRDARKARDMHKSSRRARMRKHGDQRGFATSARQLSAWPVESKSEVGLAAAPRPKVTIQALRRLAAAKTPIAAMTAYDYPTALLCETAGMEMVLVGDSLSQVALGHTTTNEVTLDEMIHHCRAVTRGAKTPFVFADMPFGAFEASVEDGVRAVIRLVKEGGVDGVKIEGGREIIPLVRRLSAIGVPVVPHLGLQPQRATSTSGYLVQGRTAASAAEVHAQAREMANAGAFAVLLEAIPHAVASHITEDLSAQGIITIGIGAGPGTSGQVLVVTDVVGTYRGSGDAIVPRFVRHFGDVAAEARRAADAFVDAVRTRDFPAVGKETYSMKEDEWEGYLRHVGGKSPQSATLAADPKPTGHDTEDGA